MLEPGAQVTPTLRLVRRLGAGGMGSVWIAEHATLRTQVVVKFMAPELAASPVAVERFSREAAAAAQVKSPHVVQMLDHGVADGTPYIAMELLEGMDLRRYLEKIPRPPLSTLVEIVTQVCRALSAAHARGIVHRDIKPDNIFLANDGSGGTFVKLLDFGIAKSQEGDLAGPTRTGAVIGTPYYMSPEQLVGAKHVDARTDLWSLGVVVFEALTGRVPFQAETVGALALEIHNAPLPLPSRFVPSLPPALDAWFARACARPLDQRFATARDLADCFAAATQGASPALSLSPSTAQVTVGELLSGLPSAPPTASARTPGVGPTTTAGVDSGPRATSARWPWVVALAVVLVGAVVGIALVGWRARLRGAESISANASSAPPPPAAASPSSAGVAPSPASVASPAASSVDAAPPAPSRVEAPVPARPVAPGVPVVTAPSKGGPRPPPPGTRPRDEPVE